LDASYEILEPHRFGGAQKEREPLKSFSPHSLQIREGCSVLMTRKPDDAFTGGTVGTRCACELHGAISATSEATISADGFTSWDRGFDAEGRQVWSAVAGGYVFKRVR
jgi:hypothetical protein